MRRCVVKMPHRVPVRTQEPWTWTGIVLIFSPRFDGGLTILARGRVLAGQETTDDMHGDGGIETDA